MNLFKNKIADIFLRGISVGLIAGTVKDIPDLFLVLLWRVKKVAFWEYVSQICLHMKPNNFIEHLIAFSIQVVFSLGLGIIYSMVIVPKISTRHYLLRGVLYGTSCWFILISSLEFYKITPVLTDDVVTPVLTLVFSAFYGLLLAYLDKNWAPGNSSLDHSKQPKRVK